VGPLEQPSVEWKARISASQAPDGTGKPGQLRDADAVCPVVEAALLQLLCGFRLAS
jgi:hypothetical protein